MNRMLTSTSVTIWITLTAMAAIVEPLIPRKAMKPETAAKTTATIASGRNDSW